MTSPESLTPTPTLSSPRRAQDAPQDAYGGNMGAAAPGAFRARARYASLCMKIFSLTFPVIGFPTWTSGSFVFS